MAGFIAKQPNGLYCRFSTVVDCPTHWNMTEEDYLNNATGASPSRDIGKETLLHHVRPFSEVLDYFIDNNMTQEEFNKLIIEMSN